MNSTRQPAFGTTGDMTVNISSLQELRRNPNILIQTKLSRKNQKIKGTTNAIFKTASLCLYCTYPRGLVAHFAILFGKLLIHFFLI